MYYRVFMETCCFFPAGYLRTVNKCICNSACEKMLQTRHHIHKLVCMLVISGAKSHWPWWFNEAMPFKVPFDSKYTLICHLTNICVSNELPRNQKSPSFYYFARLVTSHCRCLLFILFATYGRHSTTSVFTINNESYDTSPVEPRIKGKDVKKKNRI